MYHYKLFYYKLFDKTLVSIYDLDTINTYAEGLNIKEISEKEASAHSGLIYALTKLNKKEARRSYCASTSSLLFMEEENLSILLKDKSNYTLPTWLTEKLNCNLVKAINLNYHNWQEALKENKTKDKFKVNVVGLGDVGATLITGLRLLANNTISTIGIFDKDENKIKRLEFEGNQIQDWDCEKSYANVEALTEADLFNCDMFVFCVSVGVPKIGSEKKENAKDVRLVQFEGNSKIVGYYAKLAREANFKGIFAVVSDPVDLLCRAAYDASNINSQGEFDYKGLAPEQIHGYGLGVMNARAAYFARKTPEFNSYLKEGRAFGPHGEGLIIANSIENYNEDISNTLTYKTKTANLEVRSTGYKPYIAPALSSGSYSLLATLRGEWHYSASFIDGVFIGCKNRLTEAGIELEKLDLPETLMSKLQDTYNYLHTTYHNCM